MQIMTTVRLQLELSFVSKEWSVMKMGKYFLHRWNNKPAVEWKKSGHCNCINNWDFINGR